MQQAAFAAVTGQTEAGAMVVATHGKEGRGPVQVASSSQCGGMTAFLRMQLERELEQELAHLKTLRPERRTTCLPQLQCGNSRVAVVAVVVGGGGESGAGAGAGAVAGGTDDGDGVGVGVGVGVVADADAAAVAAAGCPRGTGRVLGSTPAASVGGSGKCVVPPWWRVEGLTSGDKALADAGPRAPTQTPGCGKPRTALWVCAVSGSGTDTRLRAAGWILLGLGLRTPCLLLLPLLPPPPGVRYRPGPGRREERCGRTGFLSERPSQVGLANLCRWSS